MLKNNYYKIKVELIDAKDKLFRLFYVKSGTDLESFILRVLYTLRCSLEHLYEVRSNKYLKDEATVDDLPSKSLLVYDFGDDWRFVVTKYKITKELSGKGDYILLDAKGQGIWEDFIRYFYMYIDGDLTDDNYEEMCSDYLCSPLPNDCKKPSDFDLPVDIKSLNEDINKNTLTFSY
ncbi:MAG: hypothetical protein SPL00_04885 [Bacilli bacterium]|nr:hypothetical protein [Bacilli bacterium]